MHPERSFLNQQLVLLTTLKLLAMFHVERPIFLIDTRF
jgi:hypothetical protein